MIISIKNKVKEIIYRINNRGVLISSYDYDFYDDDIFVNDFEVFYND